MLQVRRHDVIDAARIIVVVLPQRFARIDEQRGAARHVRQRQRIHGRQGQRIDAIGRDDVARELLADAGAVVRGSKMPPLVALKLPCRCSAVGTATVVNPAAAWRMVSRS